MALIFMDGFDKYGPPNASNAWPQFLLQQEWTSATANAFSIVTGLSATGYALTGITNSVALSKTLGANYGRIIGGFRFSIVLGSSGNSGITFYDAGTAQFSITFTGGVGTIVIRTGTTAGTALATSAGAVAASSVHYLEWDVTIGATGAYQVWLDGVSILSGSGNTRGGATNNFINQIAFVAAAGIPPTITVDDFYLFDTTGTTNNAPLLTSPRIETRFPNADSAVQFALGPTVLGSSVPRGNTFATSSANQLRLRAFTPVVNCTLNSIGLMPAVSNGVIQLRPVAYTDSAGVPGTLMSAGSTVVGITGNTAVTLPLTTPQSLVAGTQYWLGHMCDISVSNSWAAPDTGTANIDRIATATFASGAPGTAPVTSFSTGSVIWGNIVGVSNWYSASQTPTQGNLSYVYDATVGHEDLYNFQSFNQPPLTIYAVAVKANLFKTDAGNKTASIRLKSSSTDSAGSGGTGLTMSTSGAWVTSLYERDPNGNIAWTPAAVNASQCGVKVES